VPGPPRLPQRIAEPLTERGRDLLRRDLALDAVEVLRQAVAAGEPSSPDVLADAYLDSGSFHAAAEWLSLLVARGYVRFAGRLGVALAETGDRDGAEEALRLAIANGESAAANDLGILLRDMGRDAEAVQVLVRAADHGDGQAADNLVSFLLDADELVPAVAAAERYYDTSRPDTVVALADARAAARRDAEAEQLYRLADELGALRAHVAYATFLLATRADRSHAEHELREAVRHREPGASAALGVFLVEDGRVAEGRDQLVAGASSGDRAAAAALAELDGDDPDDD
jgi:tetratricopeptide (TPR) repeat protein